MNGRHRIAWLAGGVVALAIGFAVAGLGVREIRESRSSARVAESRALAANAEAVVERSPELAALLAVEAFALTNDEAPRDSYEARNSLVTAFEHLSYLRAILRGHEGPVTAVAFGPSGTLVASGGQDGTVRLWDVRKRTELYRLQAHTGTVTTVAFNPRGTLLASAGSDSMIRLWNVDGGTPAGELRGHRGGIQQIVFSPDGRRLASAGDVWHDARPDSTVRVWDLAKRKQLGATIRAAASGIRFDNGGRTLTVVNMVGWITEHDARRPRPYHERAYDTSYTEYSQSEFTTSGALLVLSGESGIEVWRVRGSVSRPVQILGEVWPPRLVGAGRARIGVGDSDGALTYWDTARSYHPAEGTLDPGSSMSFANGGIEALGFDRAGDRVAVGGADGTVRLATLGDAWSRLLRYDARTTRVGAPVVSPDGHWTAQLEETGDWSRTRVAIRDSVTHHEQARALETRAGAVAFHPDGRHIAVVGRDGRLRLWQIDPTAPADPLPSGFPPKGASTIAFGPDGGVLASFGWDARYGWEPGFVLWDVARWAPIGEPIPVCCSGGSDERLSFEPQGETFVYRDDAGGVGLDPILVSSDLERWRRRICALVDRSLTKQEWQRYVPDRAYRETCPGRT